MNHYVLGNYNSGNQELEIQPDKVSEFCDSVRSTLNSGCLSCYAGHIAYLRLDRMVLGLSLVVRKPVMFYVEN